MTDNDALLEAIAAAPDDGAPRLVYADWLEEQGDYPRAECIRVQIALPCTLEDTPGDDALALAHSRTLRRLHTLGVLPGREAAPLGAAARPALESRYRVLWRSEPPH